MLSFKRSKAMGKVIILASSTWLECASNSYCIRSPVHPVHGISETVLPFQLQHCSVGKAFSYAAHVKQIIIISGTNNY